MTTVYLLGALESPSSWPGAARAFAQAMDGDGTAVLNGLSHTQYLSDLERSAVSCNDNKPFKAPTPEEVIDEQLDVLKHLTRFALAVVVAEPDAGCQYWPVTPPERFLGPWNHTLRNPVLIISNTVRSLVYGCGDAARGFGRRLTRAVDRLIRLRRCPVESWCMRRSETRRASSSRIALG